MKDKDAHCCYFTFLYPSLFFLFIFQYFSPVCFLRFFNLFCTPPPNILFPLSVCLSKDVA